MIGRMHVKRTIKRTAGYLSVVSSPFVRNGDANQVCIFVYHRIADISFVDRRRDDWNVSPRRFEQQIKSLAESTEIIALNDLPERLAHLPERLAQAGTRQHQKPLVCLTFDDGFANFLHQAVPILSRYDAPATLFVPTETIGADQPMPFDRWACDNQARTSPDVWRAADWNELERCLGHPGISIGAHSHQHLNGLHCQKEQFVQEAGRSREILVDRFGPEKVSAYAYPYGSRRLGQVPSEYVQAVRDAGFRLAVTTDLGLADTESDLLELPRVEAHVMDGPAVVRAKACGALGPYYFTDRMRRGHRA